MADSSDGEVWNQQEALPRRMLPSAIAVGPAGIAAFGVAGQEWASATSADGLTWTVNVDGFPGASPNAGIQVTDLAPDGNGWLAVGREDDPDCALECMQAPSRTWVWRSPDGLHWTRVADQPSLQGVGINAVTAHGEGFVAVGNEKRFVAILTSEDGVAWTRVADEPLFHPLPGPFRKHQSTEARDVVDGHGVIVAVGMDDGAQDVDFGNTSRAWWSADGVTWANGSGAGAPDGELFSVSSTPTGFLAAGPAPCGGLLGSVDGQVWSCDKGQAFGAFFAYAAAGSSTTDVAVGLVAPDDEEASPVGAIWSRHLP